MSLMLPGPPKNGPAPDETEASDEALHHARDITPGHHLQRHQHSKSLPHSNTSPICRVEASPQLSSASRVAASPHQEKLRPHLRNTAAKTLPICAAGKQAFWPSFAEVCTIFTHEYDSDPLPRLGSSRRPAADRASCAPCVCIDLACGLLGAEDRGADRVSGRLTRAGTYSLVDVTLRPMPPSNFLTSF